MEMVDGIAAVVNRAISELPVVCTLLGGLHDCEWADHVVRSVVTVAFHLSDCRVNQALRRESWQVYL